MTGIVNSTGAKSGIIGTTVGTPSAGVLSDAGALTHDAQKYAFHLFKSGAEDVSGQINFNLNVFIGSGVSQSSGAITIGSGGAGLWWISCDVSHQEYGNTNIDFNLRIDSSNVNGTRLYNDTPPSAGTKYGSVGGSWPVRLADGEAISIYGTGYISGASTNSMAWFTGVRIGNKT